MSNKKGQAIFLGIMIFIMVFITVVVLIEPVKDVIVLGRDSDHLDCDNAAISAGRKATCVLIDFTLFYFVGAVIAAAGGWFTIKRLGQGGG